MSMIRIVFALVLIIVSPHVEAAKAPDFGWGVGMPDEVAAPLRQSKAKWNEAADVPKALDSLKSSENKSLDEAYLREVLAREEFAYELLDVAMRKLKLLDECKKLYGKAVAEAGGRAPACAKRFDGPYYLLKSRIRLAIGVARAQIATEMTSPNTSNYCFQAMESAIDALRDAALDAEKAPDGMVRAKRIREFRSRLFEVWEAAQRAKDASVIGDIDLIKMWDDSGLSKQADKK